MSRASWSEQLMCLELTRLDSRSLRQSSERSSNSAVMINYYFSYCYYYYYYSTTTTTTTTTTISATSTPTTVNALLCFEDQPLASSPWLITLSQCRRMKFNNILISETDEIMFDLLWFYQIKCNV